MDLRLSPSDFDIFLNFIGEQYAWYKAYACPCITPHSGAAKPNCPLCHGKGRQWVAPINGVAGIAGAKTQREWTNFGVYEKGDIVVTIGSDSALYAMGQFDRVTALNATNKFSLVLIKGSPTEKIAFTVVSVDRVFWLSADGTTVIEGGLPSVNSDGTINWTGVNAPPIGAQYTISGSRYLEYFCYGDFPQNRNMHSGAALPKRVVLRDFDLFNR